MVQKLSQFHVQLRNESEGMRYLWGVFPAIKLSKYELRLKTAVLCVFNIENFIV